MQICGKHVSLIKDFCSIFPLPCKEKCYHTILSLHGYGKSNKSLYSTSEAVQTKISLIAIAFLKHNSDVN